MYRSVTATEAYLNFILKVETSCTRFSSRLCDEISRADVSLGYA